MSENQVTTEGNTVGEAVRKAAELLGIPAEQVDHKLDLSHFRNDQGRSVPVDTVNRIVPQLIEFGKVIKPGLGINIAPDSFVSGRLNESGVLILNIIKGGGAEKAGLKPTTQSANGRILLGDLIKEIDNKKVNDSSDLFRLLDE